MYFQQAMQPCGRRTQLDCILVESSDCCLKKIIDWKWRKQLNRQQILFGQCKLRTFGNKLIQGSAAIEPSTHILDGLNVSNRYKLKMFRRYWQDAHLEDFKVPQCRKINNSNVCLLAKCSFLFGWTVKFEYASVQLSHKNAYFVHSTFTAKGAPWLSLLVSVYFSTCWDCEQCQSTIQIQRVDFRCRHHC